MVSKRNLHRLGSRSIFYQIVIRYDSITGLPSVQKTITFEKASVLFNLAALYTQIGTKAEADEAIDNYLRGAGKNEKNRIKLSKLVKVKVNEYSFPQGFSNISESTLVILQVLTCLMTFSGAWWSC